MVNFIKRHWPLITAMGTLWAAVTICLILSIKENQGHFVYALDDPYIHMAMAKNFVQHGVWGVTKHGFSSSSSSLLWTLLLSSIYFLFGINELSPLILNIIFATVICILVYVILIKYKLNPFFIAITLLLIIFITPLTVLIFCGQEHTLHTLITIFFVYLSANILSKARSSILEYILLLIVAPLLIMARYEGLFLAFVIVCLFIAKRKTLYAIFLGGFSILPIVIYGLFSIANGWYFLPNSVLLKGNVPNLSSLEGVVTFSSSGFQQIVQNPHILVLIFIALVIFYFQYSKQRAIWEDAIVMIIIFIATIFLHMQFAKIGRLYRYEAYLEALGIVVMGISLRKYLPEKLPIEIDKRLILRCIIVTLILFPFVLRGMVLLTRIPQATKNIYEQQYQMGLFVRKFYPGQTVAANDIGAINYLADIKCFDLWGLGNVEVGRARRRNLYNSQHIYELTRSAQVKFAMVYDDWFEKDGIGGIPSQWINVGKWKILNNVVCGSDTVSFYAVDSSELDNLIENLRDFSSHLPKNVVQTGAYTTNIMGGRKDGE